ncbi:MAG: OmpA family protein [Hyphomicrobiales bacterium]
MHWTKILWVAAIAFLLPVASAAAGEVNIGDGLIKVGPDGVTVGPIEVDRDNQAAGSDATSPSTGGKYSGQTLQSSDFSNSDLSGKDFSNSKLISVDFSNSDLNGANFAGASLIGVDLSNAKLVGANFKGAKLQGVDFGNSELRKACLVNASLTGVDFSNADLSNAVLTDSRNLGSDFSNATTDGTVWKGTATCPGDGASLGRPSLTKAATIQKALSSGPNAKVDLTVNFAVDSDKILGAARAQVLEIAKALTSSDLGSSKILIEGHTDSSGADSYNLDLSYRRAISVMRTLSEEYKIDANRLQVRGHGEEQPVATNDSESGRALNRRVTLVNTGS